jgi:hypothetical protein
VEGQPGLCGVESVGHLTDAPLPETQTLKNGEPGFIRQGMKQSRCAFGVGLELSSHRANYINFP